MGYMGGFRGWVVGATLANGYGLCSGTGRDRGWTCAATVISSWFTWRAVWVTLQRAKEKLSWKSVQQQAYCSSGSTETKQEHRRSEFRDQGTVIALDYRKMFPHT